MIENKDRQWEWRTGLLRGLGQCCWQESWSEIRRITLMSIDDKRGIAFSKSIIGGALMGFDVIPIDGLMLFSKASTPAIADACERLWNGSIIHPADATRFKAL